MPRLISETQKNAFSIIAKYLRDQGRPVKTKKQLQKYVGTDTYEEALNIMIEGYNNELSMNRRQTRRQQRVQRTGKRNALQLLQSKNFEKIPQTTNDFGQDTTISNIKNAFRSRMGQTVILQFSGINQEHTFVIPVAGFNHWFNMNVVPFCMIEIGRAHV